MSKLLKTTRTTHGILRHARFINSSQKRSLFGFSRRSGYYEDARNEEEFYKKPSIFTIGAVILGGTTFALATSLIDTDMFVDSMLNSDQGYINLANYPFLNSYVFAKLWERGIIHNYLDNLKQPDTTTYNHLFSLRMLTIMCRNKTLCNLLLTETDFLTVLTQMLEKNTNTEELSIGQRVELQFIAANLRTISRVESSHDTIFSILHLLPKTNTRNIPSVNANLAEMYANLVDTAPKEKNITLLNAIFPLTESTNVTTRNIALKCCEIVTLRETNNGSEKEAVEALHSYRNKNQNIAFACSVANYALVALMYTAARASVRGFQVAGGGIMVDMIGKTILRTTATTVALGTVFTGLDLVSFKVDKLPVTTFQEAKRKAFLVEATQASFHFLLPVLVIYLLQTTPYLIIPLILGRSMSASEPYEIFISDDTAGLKKRLRQYLVVEKE